MLILLIIAVNHFKLKVAKYYELNISQIIEIGPKIRPKICSMEIIKAIQYCQ